jgi:signal transduction histidine kinase
VQISDSDVGRYPANIEAAVYFCALEAMQNAAKHSGAGAVRVAVAGNSGLLTLVVEDDGAGFDLAAARSGTGLANMRDRIEAVGGELALESRPDGGTKITARLQAAQLSGLAVT